MTFALRELLKLTNIETDQELGKEFGPLMLQVVMNLVEDMADLLIQNKTDIRILSPFELKTNDWHIALL